jgi:hypothetical protein
MSTVMYLEFPDFSKETPLFLSESGGEVGYPSRVSRKGKAGPLEAGRGKYSPPANPERVALEPLKRRNSRVTS